MLHAFKTKIKRNIYANMFKIKSEFYFKQDEYFYCEQNPPTLI